MIFVDWLVFVASLNHSLLETLSVFILSILLSKCAFLVCLITLVVSLRICLNFDHAASVFVCLARRWLRFLLRTIFIISEFIQGTVPGFILTVFLGILVEGEEIMASVILSATGSRSGLFYIFNHSVLPRFLLYFEHSPWLYMLRLKDVSLGFDN